LKPRLVSDSGTAFFLVNSADSMIVSSIPNWMTQTSA
jgi:hypothetical protein